MPLDPVTGGGSIVLLGTIPFPGAADPVIASM
jgi:hypothetical protein